MATKIKSIDHYDATPEAVMALVSDEKFQLEKHAAVGSTNAKVLEIAEQPGGGVRIQIQRDVETAGIPDFARKLLGERQTIVETQNWGAPSGDGSRTGSWKVEAKAAPLQMGGSFVMAPDGGGTTVTIEGEVKASLPLIGGKLERAVAEATEKTLAGECEFGQKWLASH